MRVADSNACLLLAMVLDGADHGDGDCVPLKTCDRCGNFLARFEASRGLQRVVGVAHITDVCVTTSGHGLLGVCPRAIAAKPLLDALKKGTRRR